MGGRRHDRSEAAAGFTLLEVMVAVAILSISLTSLLSSQMASLRATDQARQLSSVAFLAEAQLIEMEWQLEQDGWSQDDQVFEGDFADQGWPAVEYICVTDVIELPDYNELVQAKDAADTDGNDFVQDAGDQAFGMLGMAWPIIKGAIEQSIRKAWCTVRWSPDGERAKLSDEWMCEDAENECLTIATFWTDPAALDQLPTMGGAVGDDEDGDDGGMDDGGGGDRGGGDRGGGPPSSGRGKGQSAQPPGMGMGGR